MQGTGEETLSRHLDPLVGQVVDGRYDVLDVVGTGGMATVYRARDRRLGRVVAMKVLHSQFASDPDFVRRFHREAQFAAGLSTHPHVVAIHDVGDDGSVHYIVMELVEGQNLRELIAREAPFEVERAFALGRQLAAALAFAHERGLVHRDVKPENVLVLPDGRVKVTDFGIARGRDATQITQMGVLLGTAGYLSPEQARGEPVDARSDIYSAGVVLYQMLTGRLPFQAAGPVGMAMKHVHEQPAPPSQANPSLPSWVDGIALRALQKVPSKRYASAAELGAALRQPASGSEPTTVNRSPSPLMSPDHASDAAESLEQHRRFGGGALVPLGLALLALAIVAGALIWGSVGGSGAKQRMGGHKSAPSTRRPGVVARSTSTSPPTATLPPTVAPTSTTAPTAAPTATFRVQAPQPTVASTVPPPAVVGPQSPPPLRPHGKGKGGKDKGLPPGHDKGTSPGQENQGGEGD